MIAFVLTALFASEVPVLAPAEPGKAPLVMPMPDGLPKARNAPDHGKWVDNDLGPVAGPEGKPGTFMPAPLDREVLRRLKLLDLYPGLCQEHIDAVLRLRDIEVVAAATIAMATAHPGSAPKVWPEMRPSWILTAAVVLMVGSGAAGWWMRDRF